MPLTFNEIIAPYQNRNFTCASLCVIKVRDDALAIHQHHWGEILHEGVAHAVDENTYYDLASLTKLYTATSLLSLIAQGDVSLSTPLAHILPEFSALSPRPIGGTQDPHTKQRQPPDPRFVGQYVDPNTVTIKHLVTHTSGLPPWRDVYNASVPPPPPDQPDDLTIDERLQRAFERLVAYPFVGQPGDEVRYSDVGMMLLGFAIARLHASHMTAPDNATLADAIQTRVLQPIDDAITCFNPIRQHAIPRHQIAPAEDDPHYRHRRIWGEVHDENACGIGGIAGHAGLFSNALSVAHFGYTWLTNPRRFGIPAPLATQATTLQSQTDAHVHGLGWMMKSPEDASAGELFSAHAYGHTGFTGTSLWIDPDRQLIVAFLTNRVVVGRDVIGIHTCRRVVHDWVVETFA